MEKRFYILLSVFIGVLIAIFLGINYALERAYLHFGPVISGTIEESKGRGVFIKEYTVPSNPCKINDTLQITVKEAWVEYEWYFGDNENETNVLADPGYQIRVNSTKQDIGKYNSIDWSIGIRGDKYLVPCSRSSLEGRLENLPGDTIEYIVVKGCIVNNMDTTGKVLGKFVLIKK